MSRLGIIEDGAVAVQGSRIVAVGITSEIRREYSAKKTLDAKGKVVLPGFVDAHSHFVFAGSRENELEMKISGKSYMEIMAAGGGILKTVRETRSISKKELIAICIERSRKMLQNGTTTVEAKSGYGLTLEDEIKSLEVIKHLQERGPLSVVPTFLGAHAVPPEYEKSPSDYVSQICENWIPKIAKSKLATFCDVFCEKGVFEIEDSRRILESGKKAGLLPKIHADEFYALGGAELAAEVGAVSADHLLYASENGLTRMKEANVIAVLLPAASLTLMIDKYADARKMISSGLPVALGSDFSPSCWLENPQTVITLACFKLKMAPAEAVVASTINAAHAVKQAHDVGSLEPGKRADILILDAPDFRFLGYRFGSNLVDTVVKNGRVAVSDGRLQI